MANPVVYNRGRGAMAVFPGSVRYASIFQKFLGIGARFYTVRIVQFDTAQIVH
jgi:hypothetical protein